MASKNSSSLSIWIKQQGLMKFLLNSSTSAPMKFPPPNMALPTISRHWYYPKGLVLCSGHPNIQKRVKIRPIKLQTRVSDLYYLQSSGTHCPQSHVKTPRGLPYLVTFEPWLSARPVLWNAVNHCNQWLVSQSQQSQTGWSNRPRFCQSILQGTRTPPKTATMASGMTSL